MSFGNGGFGNGGFGSNITDQNLNVSADLDGVAVNVVGSYANGSDIYLVFIDPNSNLCLTKRSMHSAIANNTTNV